MRVLKAPTRLDRQLAKVGHFRLFGATHASPAPIALTPTRSGGGSSLGLHDVLPATIAAHSDYGGLVLPPQGRVRGFIAGSAVADVHRFPVRRQPTAAEHVGQALLPVPLADEVV
jgi:hypothetical protein